MNNYSKILIVWSGEIQQVSVGTNYIQTYIKKLTNSHVNYFNIHTASDILHNRLKKLKRLSSFPYFSDIYIAIWLKFYFRIVLKDVIAEISNKEINSIWLFTNSIESVIIGNELYKLTQNMNIKLNIFVWDSMEYILKSRRVSKTTERKTLDSYYEVLNNANNIACISDGMKSNLISKLNGYYEDFNATDKLTILPFPITSYNVNLSKKLRDYTKPINIVFVGSTYCWKEWNAFVKSLDKIGWKLNDRKVLLHVYGKPNIKSKLYSYRNQIIYHTPIQHNHLINKIAKYDYAYLPYFYDSDKGLVVKTSLPGKLSSYIESQLPIIFHGPAYSTAASLIKKYNLGVVLNDRDNIDLPKIMEDLDNVNSYNFQQCFIEFYNIDNYALRLLKFI